MGAMARAYLWHERERLDAASAWMVAAIFWTALAAGVLLKGPLIVMVVGLAAIALIVVDRSAGWLLTLKPIAGIIWLAVLVLPWFVAIIGRTGDAFLAQSVGEDLFGKIFTGQESHGAPPGYYFVLFRAQRLPHWRRLRSGGLGASAPSNFCWPGSCLRGLSSSWL
jgi:4-amino-4-deoxy-L-arabinose transferase-like glycosyltransferase